MKNFFQAAVYLTFIMFIFGALASFIASTGAFPFTEDMGIGVTSESDFLTKFTGLSDPTMQGLFIGVTGLTFIGAVALAMATRSVTPIGLHIFGAVFWSCWVKVSVILSYGGYIPDGFVSIILIGVTFVFVAAIVGILTGS